MHNFWLPVEKYLKLFNEDYLKIKLPIEINEINCVTPVDDNNIQTIQPAARLSWRERIDKWADRNFIETRTENIKILDNYLTLCEINGVRPIMFIPPFTQAYMKNFSKEKLDEFHYLVKQIMKAHSMAVFINGWKLGGFTDEDFFDVDHMNIRGSAKLSTILNNVIEQLE